MIYLYAVIDEPPSSLEEGLRLVRCGDLLIVVGEEVLPLTPENLAKQDAVVRRLDATAVLPIRFGEKVQDEEELCKLLKPRTSDLREALEKVRGCVQMTLRIVGEPAPLPEILGGPGTRYLETKRRAHSLPEIEPLLERLRPLVRAERIERKERLGTVYHLVRREDVPAYQEASKDPDVTVTGPFPPYAFAPGLGT